jgi:hypothetical protein
MDDRLDDQARAARAPRAEVQALSAGAFGREISKVLRLSKWRLVKERPNPPPTIPGE